MADNSEPIPTRKAPDYVERYSNNIAVEGRLVDFRLRFGRSIRSEPGDDIPLLVEFFESILISPQEAKFLADWLQREVHKYEEFFGPIPGIKSAAPVAASAPEAADAAAPGAPPAVN